MFQHLNCEINELDNYRVAYKSPLNSDLNRLSEVGIILLEEREYLLACEPQIELMRKK